MKKFLILINLFLLVGAFHSVKASEVIEYDFTVTDGYGYDLETGKYEENINLSSTSKILLSASNSGNEINFNTLDLHHLLFFDKYNKYIGYMNGDGTGLENSKYLGDVAYVTNYPSNAYMFAIVNYNYEETRDLVFLTNPTIDDIAWADNLTYRDIFGDSLFGTGKTNKIDNGDFTTDTDSDGVADNFTIENGVGSLVSFNEGNTQHNIYNNTSGMLITNDIYYNNAISASNGITFYVSLYESNDLRNADLFALLYDTGDNFLSAIQIPLNENDYTSDMFTINEANAEDMTFQRALAVGDGETENSDIGEFMVFNISNIFSGYDLPTKVEFETMLDFYKLYVNAPTEITYNDVFTNNLISNGDFDTDLSGWAVSGTAVAIQEDGYAKIIGIGSFPYIYDYFPIIENNIYYFSIDYKTYNDNVMIFATDFDNFYIENTIGDSQWHNYNTILTANATHSSGRFTIRDWNPSDWEYFYQDNVMVYELTTIFGTNLEPTTTYIEDLYAIWVDPLEDYSVYYDTIDLEALVINYTNDPGVPVDPDIDTGLDSFLDNINMNNTGGKVGLGIITMIFLAIIIGLLTKSTPVVLIVMTVSFITFTVIGWFSIWITIVILIVIVIIGLFSLNRRV